MSDTHRIAHIVNTVLPSTVPARRRHPIRVPQNQEPIMSDRPMDFSAPLQPTAVNAYPALQASHWIYENVGGGEKPEIRKRKRFSPELKAAGVKYDGDLHFMDHESSQLLNALLSRFRRPDGKPVTYKWITIKAKGKKARDAAKLWVKQVMSEGAEKGQRIIYGSFIDDGDLLLVPADSGIKSLADLGILLSDDPKAAKRARRAFANHAFMLEFTVTKTEMTIDGMVYTLHHDVLGKDITVLNFDMDTLSPEDTLIVDGQNQVKVFAKLFGKAFDHVKWTGLFPFGLAKGFGHNNPVVDQYDVVIYGSKKEFKLAGAKAYLGILGTLHESDARMDIQSGVNMGFLANPDLAPAEARRWINEIARVMFEGTEAEILDLSAVFARIEDRRWDGRAHGVEAERASVRMDRLGIGVRRFPVGLRRRFESAFENALKIVKGRMPMSYEGLMTRLYIAPNPLVFSETGRPSIERDALTHARFPHVPERYQIVCCWDRPEGPMLMWRNPNTHRNEAILVWNVHLPELRSYRFSGLVFFGYEAISLLVCMNGADMDDQVVVTNDPRYIEVWSSFVYPVTAKLDVSDETETQAPDGGEWGQRRRARFHPRTGVWTLQILDEDLERWTESGMSLGEFINLIMLDTLLSEHKDAILAYLRALPQTAQTEEAIWFMEHRTPFQAADAASNSDVVIDWEQMRKGIKTVVDRLKALAKSILVYRDRHNVERPIPIFPYTYDMPGRSRVPYDRREKKNYLVVETPVCVQLKALLTLKNQVEEAERGTEWDLVQPLPHALLTLFPATEDVMRHASGLRKEWKDILAQVREDYPELSGQKAYKLALTGYPFPVKIKPTDPDFDKTQAGVDQFRLVKRVGFFELYHHIEGQLIPLDLRLLIAVELYRQIYSQKTSEPFTEEINGVTFTRHFGDGLPDFVLHDLMTACEQAHLTGWTVFVALDRRASRRLTAPIAVTVRQGRVYESHNGLEVGTERTLPDGTYTMSPKGVIVVQAAKPELQSDFKVAQAADRMAGHVASAKLVVGLDTVDEDDFEMTF